jgi:hypothetical protein
MYTDTVCIIRMHRDYGRRHTEMAGYMQIIAGYMQIMAEYGKMSEETAGPFTQYWQETAKLWQDTEGFRNSNTMAAHSKL